MVIKKFALVTLLMLCLLFCSCNDIWEDRGKCPATICIVTESLPYELNSLNMWVYNSIGELVAQDTITVRKNGRIKKVTVERGGAMKCLVWGNIGANTRVSGHDYTNNILDNIGGFSADSLYHFAREVIVKSDTAVVNVCLRKYFAEVKANFIGLSADEEVELKLSGTSKGYRIGGDILEGGFVQTNRSIGGNSLNFRMLRQSNLDALRFDISYGRHGTLTDSFDFQFGAFLRQMGYDMYAQDMQDITIIFDFTSMTAVIQFGEWQTTIPVGIEF